jgi:hypothetical protein
MGMGIGHSFDRAEANRLRTSPVAFESLTYDMKVTVLNKNGSQYDGIFVRKAWLPDSTYAPRYNEYRECNPTMVTLPLLDEPITVVSKDSTESVLIFKGFTRDCLLMASPENSHTALVLPVEIKITIDALGDTAYADTYKLFLATEELPRLDAIVLESNHQITEVALQDIERITVHPGNSGMLQGAFIGFLLDVAYYVLYIYPLRNTHWD